MLFVLIHRIIFHDKNLMDEEILKTASNASSQAMTYLSKHYQGIFPSLSQEQEKCIPMKGKTRYPMTQAV